MYKYISKSRKNNKVTEETSQQKQTEYNYKTYSAAACIQEDYIKNVCIQWL